jgi:hypothetical protein
MHNSLRFRNGKNHRGRGIAINLLLAVCILGVIPRGVLAQSKPVASGKSPLCNRDNAIDMIKQQNFQKLYPTHYGSYSSSGSVMAARTG